MNYLAVIFCYMIKQLDGNRTVYGAYHILKGKKSSQTLQDCHLFDLASLFGVLKELDRKTIKQVIKQLEEDHFISECGKERFKLTKEGESFLVKRINELPFPSCLRGFTYKDVTEVFWRRLVLLSQCASFLKVKKNDFVPVIKDGPTQSWVKRNLTSFTTSTNELAEQLYREVYLALAQFPQIEATIFVLRLSGSHRIGLTNEQVSEKLQLDHYYNHLLFLNVLHRMMNVINCDQLSYPLLHRLLNDHMNNNLLTETAQRTLDLLNNGYNITEISSVRGLKKSTIEDHIVEIAMAVENFSITQFISKEQQKKIHAIVNKLKTKRLKEIKDRLPNDISYFAIRLTLAVKETVNGH